MMQAAIYKFLARLTASENKELPLASAFKCLTVDIIAEYFFGERYETLDLPNYDPPIFSAIGSALK